MPSQSNSPQDDTITRQKRLNSILELALDMTLERRLPFIEQACDGDISMLEQLKALLEIEKDAEEWLPDQLPNAIKSGDMFGPWQLEHKLDSGGMGSVWLANRADGTFEMQAAVKLIDRESANPQLIERFKQERQILADLIHPNICRLLDGGTTPNGTPYLVMEYVPGMTIDVWQQSEGPSIDQVLQIFTKISEAVAYAHKQGILHRDIKPANIMIQPDGEVKLLDFGIAKLQDEDTGLTQFQSEPLTPEYASPERLKGRKATKAADIYSLGLVLFQLLTGTRPRDVETSYRKAIHHWVNQAPKERKMAGDLLHSLVDFDPGERPSCAEDLLQTLHDSLQPPVSPVYRLIPAVTAFLLLIATGLYFATSKANQPAFLSESDDSQITFDHYSDTLGIIILPFQKLEDCKDSEVHVEPALMELFEELAYSERLDLDARFDPSRKTPRDVQQARQILNETNAYIVIWGNIYERCDSNHRIDLLYSFPRNRGYDRYNAQKFQLADIDRSQLLEDLRYITTMAMGDRFFTRRQYRKAIEKLEPLVDLENNGMLEQIGLAYRYLGDEDKANYYYEKRYANPLKSPFEQARVLQGLRRFKEAIPFYTEAIKQMPQKALIYSNRGNCYWVLKEYDKAIDDLNKAIMLRPDYDVAIHYRGCVYSEMGEEEKALADFKRVTELDSLKSTVAYANMGLIYSGRKEYDKAIDAFNKAIEVNPNYQNAYTYRGRTYLRMGLEDKAQTDFAKATLLEPRQAKTYWIMALAFMENGRTAASLDNLEKALSRDPTNYHPFASSEPLFNTLRENQRFLNLLKKYKPME